MALFIECRAGQTETATWHRMITTNNGEESRATQQPIEFWCAEIEPARTSKQFRDGIEGRACSCIIASTNISKLDGIIEGAQVDYDGSRRKVLYAVFDKARKVYTLGLS